MTQLTDCITPWSLFVKLSGLEQYDEMLEAPNDLSQEEEQEIHEKVIAVLESCVIRFRNHVCEEWTRLGKDYMLPLKEREQILYCSQLFNLSSSMFVTDYIRKKYSSKSVKTNPGNYGTSNNIYKMVRSIGLHSVQQAIFSEPCDIRITSNDKVFLDLVSHLSDTQRDTLAQSLECQSGIEVNALTTQPEPPFRKLWKEIPFYQFVFHKQGSYWEYQDNRLCYLAPLVEYRFQDRAQQQDCSLPALAHLWRNPRMDMIFRDFQNRYSNMFFRALYQMSIATNMELDELFLSNTAEDGYGRLYWVDPRGKRWQLDEEERKWIRVIHRLAPQQQNQLIDQWIAELPSSVSLHREPLNEVQDFAQTLLVSSYTISDALWERIQRYLPEEKRSPASSRKRNLPRKPRQVMQGIFYRFLVGCSWYEMPGEYGSPITMRKCMKEWNQQGIFERIWQEDLREYAEMEGLSWKWQTVDGKPKKVRIPWSVTQKNLRIRK